MFPEAQDLIFFSAVAVVEIKTGFANCDDFRIRRSFNQLLYLQTLEILGVMWMNTCGAPNIVVSFRNVENCWKIVKPIADCEEPVYPGSPGAIQDRLKIISERLAVQVYVCIKHICDLMPFWCGQ